MPQYKRAGDLHKFKYLIVSFSLILSAMAGLVLPFAITRKSSAAPLDEMVETGDPTDGETGTDYVTLFFFKSSRFEVKINEPNMLRFLICEKNGIGCYDGITNVRIEIPEGEKECIRATRSPLSINAVGVGRNILHLTARERGGALKTISAIFDVKNPPTNNNANNSMPRDTANEKDNGLNETSDIHLVDYEYDTASSLLQITYLINGIPQNNEDFEFKSVQGGTVEGVGMDGKFLFSAQGQWEIVIKHIKTGYETTIYFPETPE